MIKRGLLFFFTPLCCLGVAFSAALMWADYQSSRGEYIVASWQRDGIVTSEQWLNAEEYFNDALYVRPNNANYLASMAELYHWRSIDQTLSLAERKKSVVLSLSFYRKSIKSRPLWPYTWASFSLLKAQSSSFDHEFKIALQRAQMLGPWEPAVQLSVHEAGLISWQHIDINLRKIVLENFENSFSVGPEQSKKILTLTEKYDYLPSFCYYAKQLKTESSIQKLIKMRCTITL